MDLHTVHYPALMSLCLEAKFLQANFMTQDSCCISVVVPAPFCGAFCEASRGLTIQLWYKNDYNNCKFLSSLNRKFVAIHSSFLGEPTGQISAKETWVRKCQYMTFYLKKYHKIHTIWGVTNIKIQKDTDKQIVICQGW